MSERPNPLVTSGVELLLLISGMFVADIGQSTWPATVLGMLFGLPAYFVLVALRSRDVERGRIAGRTAERDRIMQRFEDGYIMRTSKPERHPEDV